MAEAVVIQKKLEAEATGSRQRGLVDAEVKEALAEAFKKEGQAQAQVTRERLDAEASGIERKALAEATGIRERLLAEAAGISEKAEAMKKLDGVSRKHEEFRLALEHERTIALERLRTNIDLGRAQAEVYSEAFKSANINIVGGDDGFYNNFLKSVTLGHSVEGLVNSSQTVRGLLDRFGVSGAGKADEADSAEVVEEDQA